MSLDFKAEGTERDFFYGFVDIIKLFKKTLRNRDAEVFAELLYMCHKKKHIGKTDMFKIVFDYDTKIEIEEKLNISSSVLRNSISQLRKHNLVTSNNTIPDFYLVDPGKEFTIKFIYKINSNE